MSLIRNVSKDLKVNARTKVLVASSKGCLKLSIMSYKSLIKEMYHYLLFLSDLARCIEIQTKCGKLSFGSLADVLKRHNMERYWLTVYRQNDCFLSTIDIDLIFHILAGVSKRGSFKRYLEVGYLRR